MDFIIVYERKQRELDNAIILKIELEKRGYSCGVYQYYEADKFKTNFKLKNHSQIILVPHLYDTKSIPRTFSRFGRAKNIVNLQYEQVLSKKWEDLGHHNPKNEAKNGVHICWGKKTSERLLKAGIPRINLKILGAIQCDMLREKYRESKNEVRSRLTKLCSIDKNKNWNIFLSSFTYADINEERLKMNEKIAGTNLEDFKKIHTESRDELICWFDKILEKSKNQIFIYRPHPDELSFEKVNYLEKKYDNFFIIRDFSVKEWINSADKLYTWYSTSIIEAHFLDVSYSILRPQKLPYTFDSVLLKYGNFIETYEEFEEDFFLKDQLKKKAIDDKYINNYYEIDKAKPSFVKYVDLLEEIYKKDEQNFNISNVLNIKCIITTFLIKVMYKIYGIYYKKNIINKDSSNYFMRWFVEWKNQIATQEEKDDLERKLREILKSKI